MSQKFPKPKIIYADIDGTLLINGRLNRALISRLRENKSEGYKIYLWSMQGLTYAEKFADTHKITDLFEQILPKPGFIVDDMGWGWTKYTRKLRL
tara:strand:- start:2411 stop:2695 length:285 start_codon:yes stop_codon:yes gene_type:complete